MAKYQLKTLPTGDDLAGFLAGIADPIRRADCAALAQMMSAASGTAATLWGGKIVGFGSYHYRYASGHEGDACRIGFASRKEAIVIYACAGLGAHAAQLARLGKHKTGVGCLYIKRLSDVDADALRGLIDGAWAMPVADESG